MNHKDFTRDRVADASRAYYHRAYQNGENSNAAMNAVAQEWHLSAHEQDVVAASMPSEG